jgi:8-oxo-dGTP pyrophosphatase MutT (NUDIX family)
MSEFVPIPSSTVLLLRDGAAGLEVFMVKRHHQIDFASGALVFPGGKVDASDADDKLRALAPRAAAATPGEFAILVSAVREAFEEVGVLLARPRGRSETVPGARLAGLAPWRERLVKREATLADLLRSEDLELATDLLHPFAHWITPKIRAKRFDTRFYVAAAPDDQAAAHDGSESVDSAWINPAKAIAEADAGARTLVFATRMNLAKLGRAKSVDDAIGRARAARIVTVCPEIVETDGKRLLRIPAEADYDVTEMDVTQLRTP